MSGEGVFVCPPPSPPSVPLSTPLCVGFGQVRVVCNGTVVWQGDDETVTLRRFARMARKRPGDWRVIFMAPLVEEEYQRNERGRWVLIRRGEGFA